MAVNDKYGTMQRKVVMAYFKILSQNMAGKTEENQEKPQHGYLVSRYLVQGAYLLPNFHFLASFPCV
jgi:hypothetical protein